MKQGFVKRMLQANRFQRPIDILEIARITGLSASHVSKIFSGTRRPSLATARKIAQAKGITLDQLYRELEEIAA